METCGLNEMPVEVWKSLGEDGIDILRDLMKIYQEEKMQNECRDSDIVLICKWKGDIQGCGIKGLMSPTMKIFGKRIM